MLVSVLSGRCKIKSDVESVEVFDISGAFIADQSGTGWVPVAITAEFRLREESPPLPLFCCKHYEEGVAGTFEQSYVCPEVFRPKNFWRTLLQALAQGSRSKGAQDYSNVPANEVPGCLEKFILFLGLYERHLR